MQKVRVIVTSNRKVVRHGIALILKAAENFEVVGREGLDVVQESLKLQPDMLFYELHSIDEKDLKVLKEIKDLCTWTKIIIFSTRPLKKESLKQYFGFCDGYLQGPVLPGLLLKAVDLACYSGSFFFLVSSGEARSRLLDQHDGQPFTCILKN